ncbi:MAG TPA: polysaccharide deacetylase family protein, partial [Candidatus Paceibacterota bacterium]|nr:polysaccharide deacetylase family protein [Candidatus Paceibacterota bacterium]
MITIYKSFVTKISIFALVAIFISIPSVAFADTTTINSVSLNGASSVTVAPSATISASVSVTTNTSGGGGSSTWDATGWRISTSSGTYACVDTANHSGNGTNSETFNITAPSTPGTYNIYLATYSNYYNGYGCYGQNDTFSQNSVVTVNVVDTTSPSVTINQKSSAPAQADPTSSSPINFTVVFSESVSDFATGDVTLSGTAGATTATVTGSGTTYNVAVSGMTSSGTVIATIAAGKAHDAAGNPNTVSTSTDNTVTYNVADTTPPSLSQVTPISTQTGDTTPSYVFSSTEAGAVTYGGSCGNGDLANAAAGNNTVTFGSLSAGTYNNCTITVTDAAHNASTPLDISSFTVNTDLFEKGMVTLSFDDGTAGQFANAHIVNDAGFKATYYIISGMMNGATACDGDCYADFMTQANVQSLFSTGNEIAAHTRTHQDLTTQNDGQLRFEIEGSRSDLLSTIGAPVSNLAFPYGTTNDTVDQELKNAGFVGSRTVIDGLNTRSTNRYELYADQVLSDTDVSEVEGWIDQAANNDEWLVLVFHKIDAGCSNPDGVPIPPEDGGGNDNYCATPSTLASIVSYLQSKESSIDVVTVSQGLAKMDNSPVSDGVAPVITQPDIVAEATSPTGASVSFSPVVTDLDTGLPASPLSTLCTIPHVPVVDEDPATVFPTIVTSGDEFPMGVTTVTCTAADTAGNYTSHPFTITVQNSAVPSVTLTTTAPAITNTSPIHVTATFSEDVTGFEATDVAVTNGTVENFDGSGSVYTFDVVPTDDGEVTVNVPENISIDIAGGNNTASNTLSTTYDNTPPIVTIDDYTTDPTNQDITVTAHTNEGTLNADSNTFTENGTFDFIATDLAGNQSTKTVTITNIDKTAPDITINNPGTDPAQSKTLTASVSDGTLLQSVTTGDVCDATLTFGPYTDLTFSTEADNGTIICYQAADALGNTDYKLSDAIGGIDTTAPAITAVNIASNNPTPTLAKPGDTVTIGFTATEILATPTVTVDGNSADVTGTNPYTATYTMAGSDPDGAVTFAIDYTDLAGNAGTEVSSTTDASTVTFDGTAPTITVDSFPTVNSDDQTSVTLSGTCSDTDGAISLTIDTVSDSPTCTTGTWSSTLDLSSLLDGSLTATASQTDAAGNIGTGTLDATKDTVAPIVTIDTIPTVTNGTPTITGTTDDDADVTVTVDGTDYTATPSSGTWSVTTNVLTDGSTLSATAQSTDAAGNTGAIATSNDFTVDAAAPIIT